MMVTLQGVYTFMLPPSHITYTLAAWDLLKKHIPALQKVDYRLVALASMGPDLIDKPLAALYFYRRYKASGLFAHTLLAHLVIAGFALWKKPHWWPYVIAFNGHAILDRLWFFPDTWYWPFRGWRFQVWGKGGGEQKEMKRAYWYAFTRRPELWTWELGGMMAGLWFIWHHRLYQWSRLWHLLRTGHLPESDE